MYQPRRPSFTLGRMLVVVIVVVVHAFLNKTAQQFLLSRNVKKTLSISFMHSALIVMPIDLLCLSPTLETTLNLYYTHTFFTSSFGSSASLSDSHSGFDGIFQCSLFMGPVYNPNIASHTI